MARFYGVKLANTLACPTVESPIERYTYDTLCDELDSSKTTNIPWRPLTNSTTKEVVAVQLLRPLQGTTIDQFVSPWPDTYERWREWISSRLDSLLKTLLNKCPMSENHAKEINPIVANVIVGAYLAEIPYAIHMDSLFVKETVFKDIINSAIIVQNLIICRPINYFQLAPGPKYFAFSNYTNASTDPCLFGKDKSNYAAGYYYQSYDQPPTPSGIFSIPSTVLVHYDRPSTLPHYLIPSAGVDIDIFGETGDATTLLLLESIIQQLRNNAVSNPARAFRRLDECYAVYTSPAYEQTSSSVWRLIQLSVAATNGYQLADRVPQVPTNAWVSTLLAQIRAPGNNPFPMYANPRYVPILRNSPSNLPETLPNWYRRIPVNSLMDTGNVHVDALPARSVPLLLQYTDNTIQLGAAQAAYDMHSTLPMTPKYNNFWNGEALMTSTRAVAADADVNNRAFPTLVQGYFDNQQVRARGVFSSYRTTADRSLLKDTANLVFAYGQYGLTGDRFLKQGESVAYFGASGAHQGASEPLVISKWKAGAIPTVPPPARVRQFGYDVTLGQIVDLRYPVPIGTYTYVYCDVDQVVNGGNDLMQATRALFSVLATCMQCVSFGGSICVKVNFPNGEYFGRAIRRVASLFESYAITKPFVNNNLEVYIHGFNRRRVSVPASPKAASVVFMREIQARYIGLVAVCGRIPLRGITDRGDYESGMTQINVINPTLLMNMSTDVDAITGIAAKSFGDSLIMSKRQHHGTDMLTLTGVRSRYSLIRMSRMLTAPIPRLDAVINQVRHIDYLQPEVFQRSISLWSGYAMFCNELVFRLFFNPTKSLVDLGTGPEARILSLVSAQKPVTLIDTRPFSESHNCWATPTDLVQTDYLDPGWEQRYPSDQITCMLSLGAAAASRLMTLIEALEILLPLMDNNGAEEMMIQLNCPIHGQTNGLPGELRVDAGTHMYHFLSFNRVEPYAQQADVERVIIQQFPNAGLTWFATATDLPWLKLALENFSSVTTKVIDNVLTLCQYMPVVYIQRNSRGVTTPVPLRVGQQGTMIIQLSSAQDRVVMVLNGAEVMSWEGGQIQSYVGPAQAVLVQLQLTITWTPSRVGTFSTRLSNAAAALSRLVGSVNVDPPDQTMTVAYPANWDFTQNGTAIDLTVSDYYDLRVFAGTDQRKQQINSEKYTIRPNGAGARILTWVVDLSDSMQNFWIQDVQSETPGQYMSVLLDQVTTHQWPNNIPLILSAPDDSMWVVQEGGVLQCILNDPTSQVPNLWQALPVNYGTNAGIQSYQVPAGDYTYVQV
ncbi:lambda C [Reptilian orthoreovirus]|uniref:Lambda C n=1 Tax=chelonian orthoreovirus TaxID=3071237 RepID=A0A1D7PVG9_9REOV|nr:lambda C [Reptilian orthoreovirus]AOM63685.1 lambda C [chelonian orthoreovirus]